MHEFHERRRQQRDCMNLLFDFGSFFNWRVRGMFEEAAAADV